MPNNYFQFKQFLIQQDNCAMKVCTDSCILGAYARVQAARTILDIGTGTGLLALMAAQRTAGHITAIEIEARAAQQAAENISRSPWPDRITVKNIRLQDFEKDNPGYFDVILCNPPFYKQSFKSPDKARNVAMHSHELTFADIIRFSCRFLAPEGALYMLLPPPESFQFTQLALPAGLYVREKLRIFTKEAGKHIRTIKIFGRQPLENVPDLTLNIRQPDEIYTAAFQDLLKAYYLIF